MSLEHKHAEMVHEMVLNERNGSRIAELIVYLHQQTGSWFTLKPEIIEPLYYLYTFDNSIQTSHSNEHI